MSASATVWLIDVFSQISLAQRKKVYQAVIHTQNLVDTFSVGLTLHMGSVDNKRTF